MRFFDDNTRSWWTPATGGANVPALNDLLAPFGLGLGDAVVHGTAAIAGMRVTLSYGVDVAKVPAGGWLHKATLSDAARKGSHPSSHGFLGAVTHGSAGGHVAVFSDSNCLDRSHMTSNCYDLVTRLLGRLLDGEAVPGLLDDDAKLSAPYVTPAFNASPPARRPASSYNFTEVSYVLRNPGTPVCFPNAACEKLPDHPHCRPIAPPPPEAASKSAAEAAAEAARPLPPPPATAPTQSLAEGTPPAGSRYASDSPVPVPWGAEEAVCWGSA
ncbi:hypothetical protein GPECTOR_23g79 [Gonium pectorale]|uniref:MBTPS1 fourth domain-containing protein n=1 Tax=Gonium pectorale TaxID=33097 RepID=A0A150GH30_GONPE|nr:hypothetical protein GPECTOR_23g79 [Gonium pectorale]|eukprot:KXZ49151.1 hypothetical protein GPECTOR_23g79 [Gonium pectorale]